MPSANASRLSLEGDSRDCVVCKLQLAANVHHRSQQAVAAADLG
jgi:hypothetical protein